jgi:hypothetical protein
MTPTPVILDPFHLANDFPDVMQVTNLLPNPSAEANVTDGGWGGSNCNVTWVATPTYGGGFGAFKLTGTTAGNQSLRHAALWFPVTAGLPYSAAAMFRPGGTTRNSRVYIDFRDAGGARISSVPGPDAAEVSGAWVRATVNNLIAPPGAVQAGIIAETGNADLIGEIHYVDQLIVVQAEAVPDYFDGDTAGYRWTGDRHNSTSAPRPRNRLPLDLNTGGLNVADDGIDWGDAAIEQYVAQLERGQMPVDFRIPNREITIGLIAGADGRDGFTDAVRHLQAKVARIQQEGGWLQRGDGLYADIVNASVKIPDKYGAHLRVEGDVVLTLEALPDFYGDEIQIEAPDDFIGGASGLEMLFPSDEIAGDYPGRFRLRLQNTSADGQRGVLVGIRSRHFSPESTAALAYKAEDWTPLDGATVESDADAISETVVTHPGVPNAWTPVLGSPALTHEGSYRVWARVITEAAGAPPQLRLVWDVGDLATPTQNDPVTPPTAGDAWVLPFGEVRLQAPPVGEHQWRAQIQAAGVAGGEVVHIDRIWLFPIDEAYSILRAPDTNVEGLVSTLAGDDFTGTTPATNLNGRTPSVGTAWATSGAASDFVTTDPITDGPSTEAIIRTASSATLRFGVLGDDMIAQRVAVDFGTIGISQIIGTCGVLARWTDSDNYLRMTAKVQPLIGKTKLLITKFVGGTETPLTSVLITGDLPQYGCRLDLTVTPTGDVTGLLLDLAGNVRGAVTVTDSDLIGGALSAGKGGIVDSGDGSHTWTRWYDNIQITEPPLAPAIIYPGHHAELRWDGAYRESPDTADVYGKLIVQGDLPRIPPSGIEERTVEVLIKTSRGDLDTLPDTGLDSFAAELYYRPSYLFPIT